jgi:hypothetical protein
MGYAHNLIEPPLPRIFRRAVPGPVRRLDASALSNLP